MTHSAATAGREIEASELIRRARESGLFVHGSPELVSLLMRLDLDRHIPARLYAGAAALLAWLHQLDITSIRTASEDRK